MLAEKMTLDFEKEVILRLIGYHVWGPSIPVRFPSFVFPFYAPKANRCRRLADVLKVGAGCFWCEVGSCGTWMRVKPFLHVDLELVFGMLVLEDIGHLPGTLVIRGGRLVELLGGASRDAEGVPE